MAFIAIILFLLIATIGRIAINYKLYGNLGTRISFSPQLFIYSLLMYIGFYGMLAISILEALHKIQPQFNSNIFGFVCGWAIIFLGLMIIVIGQHQMGSSWRYIGINSDHTELIVHGLFKKSRNPIYLGFLVFVIGVVCLLPHILMLACYVLQHVGLNIYVRNCEEPHLRRVHGLKYEEYCDRVNRFYPDLF